MLVIKIELHTLGKSREIGRIDIANNLTAPNRKGNLSAFGNYDVTIYRRGSRAVWKREKVNLFPRRRLGAYDLLFRALKKAVGNRNQ